MKKLLVLAAMTVAATNAFAGARIVVRSDYSNTMGYESTSPLQGDVRGTSLFKPEVARLYLSGNVGDATIDAGLNLRQFVVASDTAQGTAQKVMTVDKFVEHLVIIKPMGDFSFQAGKMWMNVGGFERRAIYDGDTYLTSLANGGRGGQWTAANNVPVGLGGAVVTPENMSGVGASYSITPEHKLEFQMANQTNSDTALLTARNSEHTYGLAYWGSFAEKMFQTYLSYNIGKADTTTETHDMEYIAAGFRIAPMENLSFDIEYLENKDQGKTVDMKTTSTILEARYKIGAWTPVAKYEMSVDDTPNVATTTHGFKRNAWALGVELQPKADDSFRYHLAYTSIADTEVDRAGFSDQTMNVITAGIKYSGDIAK